MRFLILCIFLTGCAEALVRPQLDSSVNYQRDIKFKVRTWNGKEWSKSRKFFGVGVVNNALSYKIRVYPPGKADMITVTSCHREEKTANPDSGWFESGYEFTLTPVKGLENGRACSFSIGLYEKKKGRHGWGLLAIDTPREKLPAIAKCNGQVTQFGGVSICQAKEGLMQEYVFDRKVEVAYSSQCAIKKSKDGINWRFLMPKGECVIYFIDRMDPDTFHQAILFGYSTIPIRGVE